LFCLWSDFYLSTILVTAIGHRKVGILAARLRFHDNSILSYGGHHERCGHLVAERDQSEKRNFGRNITI